MGESAVVDLVCGPASPLAETFQRYRLVARLGAGGQADVYRGVRLCGGVTSTAVTVKVFRINPKRPLADELRSWDKGDAALMDLNTRGVPGICRRVDGFYGAPPHVIGGAASTNDAVPYQVYDYLHGVNLREYVTSQAGFGGPSRLNATTALLSLAEVLKALHEPDNITLCPVLHMDVKPSNIMVLTNGETRLIDFTGARYWRTAEITQIAYTPESGGPEALHGEVGPAYDVHGFGAVAFYLVSGVAPRGTGAPPLTKHDVFVGRPALRDHMLAVLADRPQDRPSTYELTAWTQRLAQLVRASHVPDMGLDWSDRQALAATPRAVGRARAALTGTETDAFIRIEALERELVALRAKIGRPPVEAASTAAYLAPTSPASPAASAAGLPGLPGLHGANGAASPGVAPNGAAPHAAAHGSAANGALPNAAPLNGDWSDAARVNGSVANGSVANGFHANRSHPNGAAAGGAGARVAGSKLLGSASPSAAASPSASPSAGALVPVAVSAGGTPAAGSPVANGSNGAAPTPAMVGRAHVTSPTQPDRFARHDADPTDPPMPGARVSRGTSANLRTLRRGGGWTIAGASFAILCWFVWAAANRASGGALAPGFLAATLGVAVGVFIVLRLLGRLVIEGWMHKSRRGAHGAHLGTAAFLFAVGVTYLQDTSWIVDAYHRVKGWT